MKLGTAIRNARRLEEMSQETLALKIGVSRQTINSIEHGRSSPSWDIAKACAVVLNISLDECH